MQLRTVTFASLDLPDDWYPRIMEGAHRSKKGAVACKLREAV